MIDNDERNEKKKNFSLTSGAVKCGIATCKLDNGGGNSCPKDIISNRRTVAASTILLSDVDVELHCDFNVAMSALSKTEQ